MRIYRVGIALAGLAVAATATMAQAPQSLALSTDQATDSYDQFISTYRDADAQYFYTYSDRQVHLEHAVGPQGGLYTDYWWEARAWETVMDRYQRAGDDSSRQMIDAVFDGWTNAYSDFTENDWNDDMGWWARGSLRAYDLTGEERFLEEAESI